MKKIYNKIIKKMVLCEGFYFVLYGGLITATGKVAGVECIETLGLITSNIGELAILGSLDME